MVKSDERAKEVMGEAHSPVSSLPSLAYKSKILGFHMTSSKT